MDEIILKLEPEILELKVSQLLKDYSWIELVLLNTLYNLGSTGKGYYFESENEYKKREIIELRVVETPNELLKRYSSLLTYWSKDELLHQLIGITHLDMYLVRGLEVLKQADRQNTHSSTAHTSETYPELNSPTEYLFEKSELILFHRSENDWAYFYCSKELVDKIAWLYDKFIVYITGVKGVYPYRRFEKIIHNKKLVYEGYVYTYNCFDFMDWINCHVFGEHLIKRAAKDLDVTQATVIHV